MTYLLQDSFLLLSLYTISGIIFGSFATALIYRLPRDLDWVKKRSFCTNCNTKLGILDLFPVISYLINLGKCRHCKTKYGFKYLYIELLMGISFLAIGYHFGGNIDSIIFCALTFAIIVMSAIDFEHYIIPDEINIFIFLLGLTYQLHHDANLQQILIMPLLYLTLSLGLRWGIYFWKKREGLGLGDVKFFLAAGMWLDIEKLPVFLMFSGIAGIAIAIIWQVSGKGKLFPFGPALGISLLFCVMFEKETIKLLHSFHNLIY